VQKEVVWEKQFVAFEDEITQVTLKCNKIQAKIKHSKFRERQIDDMILFTLQKEERLTNKLESMPSH
jgi:hypothetical protein